MSSGDSLMSWDALGARPLGASHASLDLRNAIPVLDFDDLLDEAVFLQGILPRHYAGGGITITLWWAATSATVGDVKWETAIERGDTDLDADSFATGQTAVGSAAATSGILISTAIAHTAGAQMDSLVAGEPFRIRVKRLASDGADTMTGDAELLAIELRET